MKSYFVRLLNHNGQTFDAEFSSTNVRLALNAAMDATQAGLKLSPYVQVLDDKGEIVWDSTGTYNLVLLPEDIGQVRRQDKQNLIQEID